MTRQQVLGSWAVGGERTRPVLVKESTGGPDGDRLAHEAAVLRAAAHPGVVAVVDEEVLDDGGRRLVLALAGTRTLAEFRGPIDALAAVVAALATTVADLHDAGIVHGRLRAEHVVLDAGGRPVLCGFAGAEARGISIGPPRLAPQDDVADLGRLLGDLLDTAGGTTDWEPIPARRWRRAERWSGLARRSLLTVADHAAAEDPSCRPTARALAAAVVAAVPTARLAGPPPAAARAQATDGPPEDGPPWTATTDPPAITRWWPRLAGVAGLGLLVFGTGSLLAPTGTHRPAADSAPDSAPGGPAADPALEVGLGVLDCPEVPSPAADPDGDGCPSAATIGDGVVEIDGVRYGVGEPGDLLAVADWDCDGAATVALVRRPGGEVFVFDGWATAGAAVTAVPVTTVADPASVTAVDAGRSGCPRLVVTDGQGATREVAV